MKTFTRKLLSVLTIATVLTLALTPFFAPAYAQDPLPPLGEEALIPGLEGVWDWVMNIAQVALVLAIAAVCGERGTEGITAILRKVAEFTGFKFLAVHGWGSILLSLFVAAVGVLSPKLSLEFFQEFELFRGLDPTLVSLFNVVLLWLSTNYLNRARTLEAFGGYATPYNQLKFRQLGVPKK